jgi:hypothetical protein
VTTAPPAGVTKIPLEGFVTWVPSTARFLADEDDHDRARLALSNIRAEVLAWVGGHVEAARAAAIMRLTSLLAKADEIDDRMMARASRAGSHPYRIVQLLYALLLRNGPPDFGLPPPAEIPSFFADDAYTVLGDVVAQFARSYTDDAQFQLWFRDLEKFLRAAHPADPLRWDRLIAAGANVRALAAFLDPHAQMVERRPIANLETLRNAPVRAQLEREFGDLLPNPERS